MPQKRSHVSARPTRREFGDSIDWEVSQTREYRTEVGPDRKFKRRQVSTMERIAATRGPASWLPICRRRSQL
jgi:hypothetical protein